MIDLELDSDYTTRRTKWAEWYRHSFARVLVENENFLKDNHKITMKSVREEIAG